MVLDCWRCLFCFFTLLASSLQCQLGPGAPEYSVSALPCCEVSMVRDSPSLGPDRDTCIELMLAGKMPGGGWEKPYGEVG